MDEQEILEQEQSEPTAEPSAEASAEQEQQAGAPKFPDDAALELFDRRRAVRMASVALESAKANASACKKDYDASVGRLLALIDDVERPLPLFDEQVPEEEKLCPTCQGQGNVDDEPCPDCDGSGRVSAQRDNSPAEDTEPAEPKDD